MMKPIEMSRIYSMLILFVFPWTFAFDQCENENQFLALADDRLILLNAKLKEKPTIIYQTKSNSTIENLRFEQNRKNFFLLIKDQNGNYSIVTYNSMENSLDSSTTIVAPSPISLGSSQRSLYIFHHRTRLLQNYSIPFESRVTSERYLTDLPTDLKLLDYLIDEDFLFLWLLYDTRPYSLYLCRLDADSCRFLVSLIHIQPPIRLLIDWNSKKFYVSSRYYLFVFNYELDRTIYSIENEDENQDKSHRYLTKCGELRRALLNSTHFCTSQCWNDELLTNETERIRLVEPIEIVSSTRNCEKQRVRTRLILALLILLVLVLLLALTIWLAIRYLKTWKSSSKNENDFVVTHF